MTTIFEVIDQPFPARELLVSEIDAKWCVNAHYDGTPGKVRMGVWRVEDMEQDAPAGDEDHVPMTAAYGPDPVALVEPVLSRFVSKYGRPGDRVSGADLNKVPRALQTRLTTEMVRLFEMTA